MKTNEDELPWEFNQETPGVISSSATIALEQLKRDCIRFLELMTDVKVANNIDIHLRLACPLALKSADPLDLTKDDFELSNGDVLLEKMGIPALKPVNKPSSLVCDTFKRILGRYAAPHSQIPFKSVRESFSHGLTSLGMAMRVTDTAIESQVNAIPEVEVFQNETMKQAIAGDELIRKVKSAKESKAFAEKFQKKHPKIILKDLKLEKSKSAHVLTNTKSGRHPIFGGSLYTKLIHIVDNNLAHQGADKICEFFEKNKISPFDEYGDEINTFEVVKDYVEDCHECELVQKWKSADKSNSRLTEIKEEDLPQVLEFGDKTHQAHMNKTGNSG